MASISLQASSLVGTTTIHNVRSSLCISKKEGGNAYWHTRYLACAKSWAILGIVTCSPPPPDIYGNPIKFQHLSMIISF